MLVPFISKGRLLTTVLRNTYLSSFYCTNKAVDNPHTSTTEIHRKLHSPNNFEKKMLVWTGRFKSLEEIPQTIPADTLEKARSKMRIKVANYMMAATLLACVAMAISGKRAAGRGESVAKMNEDWHKEINQIPKQ